MGLSDGITMNVTNVYNRAKADIDGHFDRTAEKVKRRELQSVERQKMMLQTTT